MTTDLMLAVAGFTFVTSITPGPNNMMLLASGVNFGFVRTLPHMAGIAFGCVVMILAVGWGLGGLFAAYPGAYGLLRYGGAAYLLYLAWKIANAGPVEGGSAAGRPMGFANAAAFQLVNPKAWVMVVGAVTTYLPPDPDMADLGLLAGVFCLVNAPTIASWVGFGTALRRWLADPVTVRLFNVTMAGLLVLSLYPLVADWL
jgi:threonine/homoserine/homoserine lactone efflux protein